MIYYECWPVVMFLVIWYLNSFCYHPKLTYILPNSCELSSRLIYVAGLIRAIGKANLYMHVHCFCFLEPTFCGFFCISIFIFIWCFIILSHSCRIFMNLIVYFSGKVTNIWEQILCVQGSSDGPEQYVLYNLGKYFIIKLYFLYCLVELLLWKFFSPSPHMLQSWIQYSQHSVQWYAHWAFNMSY